MYCKAGYICLFLGFVLKFVFCFYCPVHILNRTSAAIAFDQKSLLSI